MPSTTITNAFTSNAESFTFGAGLGTAVGSWISTDGNPAGCLQTTISGKSKTSSGASWLYSPGGSTTWASLFGIPLTATVLSVGLSGDGIDYKCSAFTTGGTSHDFVASLSTTHGNYVIGSASFTATGAWIRVVPTLNQSMLAGDGSAASTCTLQINPNISTGSSNSAVMTILFDNLKISITYAMPSSGGNVFVGQSIKRASCYMKGLKRCWERSSTGLWLPDRGIYVPEGVC